MTLSATDPRTFFARAVATGGTVIGAVRPDQWARPTPCDAFDARALSGHLLAVLRRVAAIGEGRDAFSVPDIVTGIADDHWPAAWLEAAHAVRDVWADDALLDKTFTLPWTRLDGAALLAMYTNELSVHTWDLAAATGQTPAWDEQVLDRAFESIRQMLPAEGRVESFEAARDHMPEGMRDFTPPFAAAVAAGAPLIDRLVAWNGRDPQWSAGG